MTHSEQLQKTAHLAMVNLSQQEESMADLAFQALHALTDSLPEITSAALPVMPHAQDLREDRVCPSLDRGLLLSQAPHAQNGLILALRAFEGDETC